ncbi:transmembrane protein 242 isoform X2 [Stomoxys calcitrans]|uniref:Transmembrane protein 242 n=1 Tax=Stomoxys calcitrans TaxID=35570 RepID=A0A1I8QC50_STOCA|nr:transmembrane protein 242 isoform X1 [Stomoxys calcitrans]XP_059222755.1 transmembrane protein 242 isoform X2 [Stomoxys calcitrans]
MNERQAPISTDDKNHRIQAAAFLGLVGGISALFGFSKTLGKAKKSESKLVEKGGTKTLLLLDEGSALAMRALGWGTLYAVLGTGAFCFGVWKLSGAKNMEEFRLKMGSGLPKLTSDQPPTSRTDFESLTDLMKYLAAWGKE